MDEPITPGPHAEFCNVLEERLFQRLDTLQQQFTGADQIPMSGELPIDEPLERISRLHLWNCEHVQTPYELVEKGFVKPTDIPDPRNALLQFMIAATPNNGVVAEILDKHDKLIEHMTSWFEAHLVGDDDAILVEMIDNVPDTISPVKAKPVYIQLPDGDKTMLMQAWRVSTYYIYSLYWF